MTERELVQIMVKLKRLTGWDWKDLRLKTMDQVFDLCLWKLASKEFNRQELKEKTKREAQ